MTEEQIKHMVDRFLAWTLPANFNPDAGISFKPEFNEHLDQPMRHTPSGTNLFDYAQAKAMVLHMLEGLPTVTNNSSHLFEIVEGINGKLDFSGHEGGEASVRLSAGEVDMIRNAAIGEKPLTPMQEQIKRHKENDGKDWPTWLRDSSGENAATGKGE